MYKEVKSAYKIADKLNIGSTSVYRYLKEYNINSRPIRKYKCDENIFYIQYGGNKNLKNILSFLYENAEVYLNRKFSLYKKLMAQ